ncbi:MULTISPECIES: right-handed parallel beta-helix repeat-containing protein [Sphingomonas]|uniref:Right handed beta helix domain-containing protein n=1 Tax=Sphingomonas trueperi TaxID=53317 RepID=A0A7X5XYS8_9SPHN|nr:right-handed parallel beta-helix repeat-containing protein [Sphingomonas sp. ABOLD]NJB97468.1 hypothetical protein [Sphingomonas trueperi]
MHLPARSLFRGARRGRSGFRDRSIEGRDVQPRDPDLPSSRAARLPENAPFVGGPLDARDESNASPQRGSGSRDTAPRWPYRVGSEGGGPESLRPSRLITEDPMLLLIAAAITVATPAQLQSAVKTARGGDVILLQPGHYGVVTLNGAHYASSVRIRSANPSHRAFFSRLTINNARNLTLSGLEVSYAAARGEGNMQAMIRVNNGFNITLDDLYVHGVIDGKVVNDVNGVVAQNVEGFRVTNSRFREINAGIKTGRSGNVLIQNNDIGFIGSDAIEIPGSNGVSIIANTLHDFRTNPTIHPDGVQCWTTRETSGCKNVRILRNQIIGSPGHEPQGVFFGDEDRVRGYENIEISNNRFYMTMWHAIALYSAPRNVVIRYNQVIAGPNFTPWIRVEAPATVQGNVAPAYYINSEQPALPPGNQIGGLFKK